MIKHAVVSGHVYVSGGKVVVDSCRTDREHLWAPLDQRRGENGVPRCRMTVEDFFAGFVGKKGKMHVMISFDEDAP